MNLKWGIKGIQVSLIVWFSFIRHFVFTFRETIWYCIIYLTTFHFTKIPDHRFSKFVPLSVLTSTSQPRYIYPNRLATCESIKRRFGISKNSSEAEQFHPSRYSLVSALAEPRQTTEPVQKLHSMNRLDARLPPFENYIPGVPTGAITSK